MYSAAAALQIRYARLLSFYGRGAGGGGVGGGGWRRRRRRLRFIVPLVVLP